MAEHRIVSVRYAAPEPAGGRTADAAVIAVMVDGAQMIRRADDDIEGGGMRAFLAEGGTIEAYIPPPPVPAAVPELVSMRQAKLTLEHAGFLDQADAIIAAMPGLEGRLARIEWTSSASIRRDHPLVATLGTELDLPEEQIDALFIWAAGL